MIYVVLLNKNPMANDKYRQNTPHTSLFSQMNCFLGLSVNSLNMRNSNINYMILLIITTIFRLIQYHRNSA